jgi:hypothetical protein
MPLANARLRRHGVHCQPELLAALSQATANFLIKWMRYLSSRHGFFQNGITAPNRLWNYRAAGVGDGHVFHSRFRPAITVPRGPRMPQPQTRFAPSTVRGPLGRVIYSKHGTRRRVPVHCCFTKISSHERRCAQSAPIGVRPPTIEVPTCSCLASDQRSEKSSDRCAFFYRAADRCGAAPLRVLRS